MALLEKLFTTNEVANLLSLSPSRIRQLCIEGRIGTIAGGSRFLSPDDIEKVRSLQKPTGRPKKNSNQ